MNLDLVVLPIVQVVTDTATTSSAKHVAMLQLEVTVVHAHGGLRCWLRSVSESGGY